MKFAHLADCHLGSWRQPQLQELNLQSFKKAIETCISEKVEFIVISGDLFDSAYPPIETLKETFSEFKKIKENKISCYIIAGSHDFSASGRTFLDVLEKAGFCKNVFCLEERENGTRKILNPVIAHGAAIYGYPGKKSGLEIKDLREIKFQDSPGLFRIFMLHTTITGAKGTLPIDSINETELPKADYYALGHLHLDYCKDNFVYPGPIFPNNFEELERLKGGSFYIIESEGQYTKQIRKIELKLKDVVVIYIRIDDAFTATEKIISEIDKYDDKQGLTDKIVLLRLSGKLQKGKTSDMDFVRIQKHIEKKQAYVFLKNTSKLSVVETEIEIEINDIDKIEEEVIKKYSSENPSRFNTLIMQLVNALEIEKKEDEKNITFQTRLLGDLRRLLNF